VAAQVDCRTLIRFRASAGEVAADLVADEVSGVLVNGRAVGDGWDGLRLTVPVVEGGNTLEARGLFPWSTAEQRGYRQAGDRAYLHAFPRSARRSFCCFDDRRFRARIALTISAPPDWDCVANAPVVDRPQPGRWEFATSAPIAPAVVAMAAGPWPVAERCEVDTAAGPVPVYVRGAGGVPLAEQFGRYLLDYERLLGMPYPYRKLDVVFVPDLPVLAFSAPGLILVSDAAIEELREPGYRAIVLCHELGHSWFGGLVDCADDGWLVEALATYASRTLISDSTPGPDAAYAPDAALITAVETQIGREATIAGLRDFVRRFANTTATPADLAHSWSRTSAQDLTTWTTNQKA
jgi:aminopeptidase N